MRRLAVPAPPAASTPATPRSDWRTLGKLLP